MTGKEHQDAYYVFSSEVDVLSLYLKARQLMEELAACISLWAN